MASSHNNPFKLFLFFAFVLVVFSHICTGRYHGVGEPNDDPEPPREHGPVLYDHEVLNKGDTMTYGNYTLTLKHNCRLVLYDHNRTAWGSPKNYYEQDCHCFFTTGILAIFTDTSEILWQATEFSYPKLGQYVLILQRNRDLVIYGPKLDWTLPTDGVLSQMRVPAIMDDTNDEKYILYSGETLGPGDSLKHGTYSLKMQSDCNLVFHNGDKLVWSSESSGRRGDYCFCQMQRDGNLVVVSLDSLYSKHTPIWAAFDHSHEKGDYALVLSSDGHCGIYGTAIWSTDSAVEPLIGLNAATKAPGIASVV